MSILAVSSADAIDTVTLDVPLLIRVLEHAREDIGSDVELHNFVERIIGASKTTDVLTMNNYTGLVESVVAAGPAKEPTKYFNSLQQHRGAKLKTMQKVWKVAVKKAGEQGKSHSVKYVMRIFKNLMGLTLANADEMMPKEREALDRKEGTDERALTRNENGKEDFGAVRRLHAYTIRQKVG